MVRGSTTANLKSVQLVTPNMESKFAVHSSDLQKTMMARRRNDISMKSVQPADESAERRETSVGRNRKSAAHNNMTITVKSGRTANMTALAHSTIARHFRQLNQTSTIDME